MRNTIRSTDFRGDPPSASIGSPSDERVPSRSSYGGEPPSPDVTWRQLVDPRWRDANEELVAVVSHRVQHYPSIALLLTTYFPDGDFALEAVRSCCPQTICAWDLTLIEEGRGESA